MFIVSPSLYSGDFLHLAAQLDALRGMENLHLDIDDGNFVRGISFGADMVQAVAGYTQIPLDAHLEVLNPCAYVEPLCAAGVRQLCAHAEALPFPSLFLSDVHRHGAKAGLALNLKTPAEVLAPYADQLDYVLLVSVEADYDGLPFRPGVLGKVRAVRALLPGMPVWVDGGVNDANLADVVLAGADAVVLGRAVFRAREPLAAWRHYRDAGEALRRRREDGEQTRQTAGNPV